MAGGGNFFRAPTRPRPPLFATRPVREAFTEEDRRRVLGRRSATRDGPFPDGRLTVALVVRFPKERRPTRPEVRPADARPLRARAAADLVRLAERPEPARARPVRADLRPPVRPRDARAPPRPARAPPRPARPRAPPRPVPRLAVDRPRPPPPLWKPPERAGPLLARRGALDRRTPPDDRAGRLVDREGAGLDVVAGRGAGRGAGRAAGRGAGRAAGRGAGLAPGLT